MRARYVVSTRADEAWSATGLTRITLHECLVTASCP
jgi:hypothetical protein